MRCDYFEAGTCRSCTHLDQPYADQVRAKLARCHAALDPWAATLDWLPPVTSAEAGFRNKAKMVVTGPVDAPRLGILDPRGPGLGGVDLRRCPLYSPDMHEILDVLADFVRTAALTPYDVTTRRGELKHVLVTQSPDGEFLVRWVLRSTESLARIRKHLPALLAREPRIVVVTVNLLPGHKAASEGEEEIVLTEAAALRMRLDRVSLQLPPRSFFQTNTAVATALYDQVSAWADEVAPSRVADLYCGVGGFALHLAAPGREVRGVEISADAIEAASRAAAEAGFDREAVDFRVGDATAELGADDDGPEAAPEMVVLNPPRRGLGPALCTSLDASPARWAAYSSCNVDTLARDLAALPSWTPRRARVCDMFPHTDHVEVLVLLEHTPDRRPVA